MEYNVSALLLSTMVHRKQIQLQNSFYQKTVKIEKKNNLSERLIEQRFNVPLDTI